jgi:DNA-binding transcriptional LysR family regulator
MTLDMRLFTGAGTLASVVEAGSFKGAGESLGLTPSGVSRSISRLESQLGIRLFHRHARAIKLTEEGARFYAEVQPLLTGIAAAARVASESVEAVTGRLRVCVDSPFAHIILAPRIKEYLGNFPDLELDLIVRDGPADMVSEGVDVAIRFGRPERTGLIVRKVSETRILTCASPDYTACHETLRHPEELLHHQHNCILLRDHTSGRPRSWFFSGKGDTLKVDVRGSLSVTDPASLISVCEGGYGIAQLPYLYCAEAVRVGRLVPILSEWEDSCFPLIAYIPTKRHMSAKVRSFLKFVDRLVRTTPGRVGDVPAQRSASPPSTRSTEPLEIHAT